MHDVVHADIEVEVQLLIIAIFREVEADFRDRSKKRSLLLIVGCKTMSLPIARDNFLMLHLSLHNLDSPLNRHPPDSAQAITLALHPYHLIKLW